MNQYSEKNGLKILIVSDSYKPQICSATDLMSSLAEKLADRGNKITVLTIKPDGRIQSDININDLPDFERINKVDVIRVKLLPMHTKNFILRGINTVLGSKLLSVKAKRYLDKIEIDSVLFYSPPITLIEVAHAISKRKNAKLIMLLRDLFPQNAIDLGILKNKLAIKLFQKYERKCYRLSDWILPQSETNKTFIVEEKGVPESKIKILYNWVDLEPYKRTRRIDFKKKLNINGNKLCLYAGTMGPAQDLKQILDVAKSLENENVVFLFAGDGRERKKLKEYSKRKKIRNIIFKDYFPQKEYIDLVRSSDVGVISLNPNNHTPIVPGKLVSYMAGGLPIMAIVNKESIDIKTIIDDANCGKCIMDGNVNKVSNELSKIINNNKLITEYGNNSLKYLQKHFSADYAADLVENLSRKQEVNMNV